MGNKESKKSKVITVAKYPNHEMAFVMIDGKSVFAGNYWDFHPGAHGKKIAGYDLSGKWDKGFDSLANALKAEMLTEGLSVSVESKTLSNEEYAKLGF